MGNSLRTEVGRLEAELAEARHQLDLRESEVDRLTREVHKLKCVLDAKAACPSPCRPPPLPPGGPSKKQGVSGQSGDPRDGSKVTQHEKDFASQQVIRDAILTNDFLNHLVSSQVRDIVGAMYLREVEPGTLVIREGDVGSHLYVAAEGELEVLKEGKLLSKIGPGKAFGELALLYNCTRTASVRAVSHASVWVLDRRDFQAIMMSTRLQTQEANVGFLKSVPLLQQLPQETLSRVADVLQVAYYRPGETIIKQGTTGDTFYIIISGTVRVTQITGDEEVELRRLERGAYFGEQALLKDEKRTANVIALDPGTECLTLDRKSFKQLIGDLEELQTKQYDDVVQNGCAEYANLSLDHLDYVATLGIGGFGRVELVQNIQDKSQVFALKCLPKKHIVETQQQDHVLNEKSVMLTCRHPFICRMYRTFKNSKYIFMLMEPCLGGEVWTILRDRGGFDDDITRFITGCVIEALEYLHGRNIIYRDLKPENLLLDSRGYVKMVDFGFSKYLRRSSKTWTFCGTPEYVAPEVIENRGHDRAVDFWSIGVLMWELFTGVPPFTASDPLMIYHIILRGIEALEVPDYMSQDGHHLIRQLCRRNPAERLGYQKGGFDALRNHRWFQNFDWEGLRKQTLTPPIVPKVRGPTDVSNFDVFPKNSETPEDELSNWDECF